MLVFIFDSTHLILIIQLCVVCGARKNTKHKRSFSLKLKYTTTTRHTQSYPILFIFLYLPDEILTKSHSVLYSSFSSLSNPLSCKIYILICFSFSLSLPHLLFICWRFKSINRIEKHKTYET